MHVALSLAEMKFPRTEKDHRLINARKRCSFKTLVNQQLNKINKQQTTGQNVAPKPPKGGSKCKMAVFLVKSHFA